MVGREPSESVEDEEVLDSDSASFGKATRCVVRVGEGNDGRISCGGVGGCTHNMVGGNELLKDGSEEVSEANCICPRDDDEEEDSLRGIEGKGDPALLEFRENSMMWGNDGFSS